MSEKENNSESDFVLFYHEIEEWSKELYDAVEESDWDYPLNALRGVQRKYDKLRNILEKWKIES